MTLLGNERRARQSVKVGVERVCEELDDVAALGLTGLPDGHDALDEAAAGLAEGAEAALGGNSAGSFCADDGAAVTWTNWSGNSIIGRAANAIGSSYGQYLEARDGLCVVCR